MHVLMDLGTSHFRAAATETSDILNEPCVVAKTETGRTIIGSEAARMVGRNPDVIRIVHPMEAGAVKDLDAVVQVIEYAARRLAPSRFARKFTMTLSFPTGLTHVEKKAVEEAAKLAGAKQVHMVDASVAAAVGAGLPIESPTGCLVLDLGAGVTEAAVLSMRGVVNSRRLNRGGRDIDVAIADAVRKEYGFLLGSVSAENLKKQFGAYAGKVVAVKGRNRTTGLPGEVEIPKSVVDAPLNSYCESVVDLMVQAISSCPPELAGDIVDRGMVVLGGGAQMRAFTDKLLARTEVPVVVADNPDTCIILGLMKTASWRSKGSLRGRFPLPSLPWRDVREPFHKVRAMMGRKLPQD